MLRDMDVRRLEEMALPGDTTPAAVGLRLRAAMHVAGMTQTELARMIGKTQGAIGNAVRGDNYPSVQALQQLYRATRIDFNFFLIGATSQLPADVQIRLLVALETAHTERDRKQGSS